MSSDVSSRAAQTARDLTVESTESFAALQRVTLGRRALCKLAVELL
jgi:hypothetical protein